MYASVYLEKTETKKINLPLSKKRRMAHRALGSNDDPNLTASHFHVVFEGRNKRTGVACTSTVPIGSIPELTSKQEEKILQLLDASVSSLELSLHGSTASLIVKSHSEVWNELTKQRVAMETVKRTRSGVFYRVDLCNTTNLSKGEFSCKFDWEFNVGTSYCTRDHVSTIPMLG